MKMASKRSAENALSGAVLLLWLVTVLLPSELVIREDAETSDPDVLFEDDFAVPFPLSSWSTLKPTEDNKADVAWAVDGAYRMSNPPSGTGALSVQAPQPETIGDVSVEVDATRVGGDQGDDALWGVTCRTSVYKGDLYYFAIFRRDTPVIAKLSNNKVSILAIGTPTDAIKKDDKSTNHIRGDCVGSRLTLYVNDQKLLETTDDEFTSGGVGLAVESAYISFDNFVVSKP